MYSKKLFEKNLEKKYKKGMQNSSQMVVHLNVLTVVFKRMLLAD